MKTHRQSSSPRHGIVLLVALGLLALFSVLTATFVVFSTQANTASVSIGRRATDPDRPQDLLPEVVRQVISGSTDHRSAAFNHDLLGDLYGVDSVRMRVAHYRVPRGVTNPIPMPEVTSPPRPEVQAGSLKPWNSYAPGTPPPTTLFRFPTRFARWNYDGTDSGFFDPYSYLTIPEIADTVVHRFPIEFQLNGDNPHTRTAPNNPNPVEPDDIYAKQEYDDVYSGRVVTFLEGPLRNQSFRIVRSFGDDNNTSHQNGDTESILAQNLIIDLSEMETDVVTLPDGRTMPLWETVAIAPGALLYGPGPDGAPGIAGVNDQTNVNVGDLWEEPDDLSELGAIGSDDVGYLFVINGGIFNGGGADAGFERDNNLDVQSQLPTVTNNRQTYNDENTTAVLQPNARHLGTTFNGEPDEAYDAPDAENMFLAWQPSDRSSTTGAIIHTDPLANSLINQMIVPSYHRPALISYLVNLPIQDSNGVDRTFNEMLASNNRDRVWHFAFHQRLRRAILRPLPFAHLIDRDQNGVMDPIDLDGDGELFDGNPEFSGSNVTPVLNTTLPVIPRNNQDLQNLRNLVLWLCNGPWDVDNDGDGIPDSVWVDFRLPTFTTDNGVVVRPMVAPLIEDLDGRINLNTAGNYGQQAGIDVNGNRIPFFTRLNNTSDAGPLVTEALRETSRGMGRGPADIYPGFLFGDTTSFNGNTDQLPQPAFNNANLLSRPFGRLLSHRWGGDNFHVGFPGTDVNNVALQLQANDAISQMIHPAQREVHRMDNPMGIPMDSYGRGILDLNIEGGLTARNLSTNLPYALPNGVANETFNDPYEQSTDATPVGNDTPYTVREMVSVTDSVHPDRLALSNRLKDLLQTAIADNPNLARLITTESRTQQVPELSGYSESSAPPIGTIVDLYVDRLERNDTFEGLMLDEKENVLKRMVAIEFRKGTKLNLNRQLGNGVAESNLDNDDFVDNSSETFGTPAPEPAFPFLVPPWGTANASYLPYQPSDYDDFADMTGQELLARHLYTLMFMLIYDPDPSSDILFPNYPYPSFDAPGAGAAIEFAENESGTEEAALQNAYVAGRIAQWAVNVVDFRDTDATMTRFRYDPNPFDENGWDTSSEFQTVWGMEPSDLVLTEAFAIHDRGVANTTLEDNAGEQAPAPYEPDGDEPDRNGEGDPVDADLDQVRIPRGSAFVEFMNIRDHDTNSDNRDHFPAELYGIDQDGDPNTPRTERHKLDLGRIAGTGLERSPVWRLAVSSMEYGSVDDQRRLRSPRWLADGDRLARHPSDPFQVDAGDRDDPDGPYRQWATNHRYFASFEPSPRALLNVDGEDVNLTIDRIVWFADLDPLSTEIADSALGLPDGDRTRVYRNDTDVTNTYPLIGAGEYGIIAPRLLTSFGQTSDCVSPSFKYNRSNQELEILRGADGEWQVRYTDLDDDDARPPYPSDSNTNFRVRGVVPIIAQGLFPHQHVPRPADSAGQNLWDGWRDYEPLDAAQANERVAMGFNISEPLPGLGYYPAPFKRLNSGADRFPIIDAYYDGSDGSGYAYDVPFDERASSPMHDPDVDLNAVKRGGNPAGQISALTENGQSYLAQGSFEDVRTAFLQRLADPTRAYDAGNNPYITVDWITFDLHVFSSIEKLDEGISGGGSLGDGGESLDPMTPVKQGWDINERTRFDTRRKIPRTELDRYGTVRGRGLLHRGMHMLRQNVLTRSPPSATRPTKTPYFNFDLINDHDLDGNTLRTGLNERLDGQNFPATLGFLNREFGVPLSNSTVVRYSPGSDLVGRPGGTYFQSLPWFDRDLTSPHEIMMVPACSNARLGQEFTPGSRVSFERDQPLDQVENENPVAFGHLLPWESGYDDPQMPDQLLGERQPGFELIFDFVDTGPTYGSDQRWLSPSQLRDDPNGNGDPVFEQAIETLKPPFNSIARHRSPGRINLNTTPDFLIDNANNHRNPTDLDRGEDPSQPNVRNRNQARFSFNNQNAYSGRGDVHRALTWGHSTRFELDENDVPIAYAPADQQPIPSVTGEGHYEDTQDTPYGHNFKGFIESRTGYSLSESDRSDLFNNNQRFDTGNRLLHPSLPTRFAGIFGSAGTSDLASVRQYLPLDPGAATPAVRRPTDMNLLRSHPDLSQRRIGSAQADDDFDVLTDTVRMSDFTDFGGVRRFRSSQISTPLFERSSAQRHREQRLRDRNPLFRRRNTARLSNLTTHHSNVFLIRFTIGYFEVDPQSGEVGREYGVDTNQHKRRRGVVVVDRSIPVHYDRGYSSNVDRTVLFQDLREQ